MVRPRPWVVESGPMTSSEKRLEGKRCERVVRHKSCTVSIIRKILFYVGLEWVSFSISGGLYNILKFIPDRREVLEGLEWLLLLL